ncbi:hypothetical protein SRHO_G00249320 [Serrasalmus rhombeus]
MSAVTAENKNLKERISEIERYKRLKEHEGENSRERIRILSTITPQWSEKMEDLVDSAHRLGRRVEGKHRQIIIQFTKRIHRDSIWRPSKNHAACKEHGVRFTEDLLKADKEARKLLTANFYKHFWSEIHEFLYKVLIEALDEQDLPASMKQGVIVLIPKPEIYSSISLHLTAPP